MKIALHYLIIFCILVMTGFVYGQAEKSRGVEIYLVELPKEKEFFPLMQEEIAQDKQYLLKQVVLPDTPVIAFDDIEYYDWKTHEVVLTKNGYKKCKEQISMDKLGSCGSDGIPFVVAIDRKPIYIGFITNIFSCSPPPEAPNVAIQPLQEVKFIIWSRNEHKHIIENKELHDYLVKYGKIKE